MWSPARAMTLMLAAPVLTFAFYGQTGAIALRLLQMSRATRAGFSASAPFAAATDATAAWAQWILLAWCAGVFMFPRETGHGMVSVAPYRELVRRRHTGLYSRSVRRRLRSPRAEQADPSAGTGPHRHADGRGLAAACGSASNFGNCGIERRTPWESSRTNWLTFVVTISW